MFTKLIPRLSEFIFCYPVFSVVSAVVGGGVADAVAGGVADAAVGSAVAGGVADAAGTAALAGGAADLSTAGLFSGGAGLAGGASDALAGSSLGAIGGTIGGVSADTLGADAGTFAGEAAASGQAIAGSSFIPGISNGSLLQGGASLANGLLNSSAAGTAASAQQAAAAQASQTQLAMFNATQANLSPYMISGQDNLANINSQLKSGALGGQFTNADLNANLAPNYAFQLQQGQQALQNSQAAGNGALSGAALKDMQNFTQNTAAGAYQNAYSNWLSTQNLDYGQQANLASLGENASAINGNLGVQTGQSIAQNTIGAANASAAGTIGQANAISGGVNNALGYYQLNQLLGNNNSSTTSST